MTENIIKIEFTVRAWFLLRNSAGSSSHSVMYDKSTSMGMVKTEKQSGFSLVELMIVVSIVGILATAAVYNVRSGRARAAAREFVSDTQRAKMEAVKRNSNVVIVLNSVACPGLPGAVPSPGGGYTVFVDNVTVNNALDIGEPVIVNVTMPRNVAICNNTLPGNITGFTSKGLLVRNPVVVGLPASGTVTLNNDQGLSYIVSLRTAGGIQLQ